MNEVSQIHDDDLTTPTTFLGSGKFGRVFLSRYKNEEVVYKIMKHGISISMFINEINILQSLQKHENIVQMYGYSVSSKQMIIIMEHIKGITLHDLICYYDIPYTKMLFLCRQIVSTMIYIHSHNIIYCDLKPDNIMIFPETYQIKILDFGLSIQLEDANTILRGEPCGTTGYIAPEVMFHGCFGLACDVYSFGVLLYVICTGNNPCHIPKMKPIFKSTYERNLYKLFCQCVQSKPKNRPTFVQIYNVLSRLEQRALKYRDRYFFLKRLFCCSYLFR